MFSGSARITAASPRAISGVSPEALFGETPNNTRQDAYAPQTIVEIKLLCFTLDKRDMAACS